MGSPAGLDRELLAAHFALHGYLPFAKGANASHIAELVLQSTDLAGRTIKGGATMGALSLHIQNGTAKHVDDLITDGAMGLSEKSFKDDPS